MILCYSRLEVLLVSYWKIEYNELFEFENHLFDFRELFSSLISYTSKTLIKMLVY